MLKTLILVRLLNLTKRMTNIVVINKKIKKFNKTILVSGDKSLSIRWVLFASLSSGNSKAYNLLMSEDVIAALNAIKKLGIKVNYNNNFCQIEGKGLNGYKYKKNITSVFGFLVWLFLFRINISRLTKRSIFFLNFEFNKNPTKFI